MTTSVIPLQRGSVTAGAARRRLDLVTYLYLVAYQLDPIAPLQAGEDLILLQALQEEYPENLPLHVALLQHDLSEAALQRLVTGTTLLQNPEVVGPVLQQENLTPDLYWRTLLQLCRGGERARAFLLAECNHASEGTLALALHTYWGQENRTRLHRLAGDLAQLAPAYREILTGLLQGESVAVPHADPIHRSMRLQELLQAAQVV